MLPPFIPLPKFLFDLNLSINAKLLYGLLLNRTMLSQRSDWKNKDGNIYVIYTIAQLAKDINRSERTVNSGLKELEKSHLIKRKHQGLNRANFIYVLLPDSTQISSPTHEKNFHTDTQKTSCTNTQNLPTSNTEYKYKDISNIERTHKAQGKYKNVYLSENDFLNLKAEYPLKFAEYIERLSEYMKISGKKYANHASVIRKWILQDNKSNNNYSDYDYQYKEGECL